MNDLDRNSKKFWSELNKIPPISKKNDRNVQGVISMTTPDGSIKTGKDLADYLNDHFLSIGPTLANNV